MDHARKFFRRRRRRRRPPENHDGENYQNGNLVFQKCPSGLGGYGNGLDLLKCWFWVRIFQEKNWDGGLGRFLGSKNDKIEVD